MWLKCTFHCHKAGYTGQEIVDIFYNLGFDCITITDYDAYFSIYQYPDLSYIDSIDTHGMLIIKGMEFVKFRHIVGVNLPSELLFQYETPPVLVNGVWQRGVPDYASEQELIARIKNAGGYPIMAHPEGEIADGIDCYERVNDTIRYLEGEGKGEFFFPDRPFVGVTDWNQVGHHNPQSYTLVEVQEKTIENVIQSVAQGKVKVYSAVTGNWYVPQLKPQIPWIPIGLGLGLLTIGGILYYYLTHKSI